MKNGHGSQNRKQPRIRDYRAEHERRRRGIAGKVGRPPGAGSPRGYRFEPLIEAWRRVWSVTSKAESAGDGMPEDQPGDCAGA